jgi:hypothetical protein
MEEILFQDLAADPSRKVGYAKVKGTCELAAKQGYEWAWIDTCCIDKSSSAESSEAINSMFRWYQKASVCYAYLSDISWELQGSGEIVNSRWFTRGWTLQELLAPNSVEFYTDDRRSWYI